MIFEEDTTKPAPVIGQSRSIRSKQNRLIIYVVLGLVILSASSLIILTGSIKVPVGSTTIASISSTSSILSSSSSTYTSSSTTSTLTTRTPIGMLIPFYEWGSGVNASVAQIIAARKQYPTVPIAVIVNFGNGPGTVKYSSDLSMIQSLQGAGCLVLGYVWPYNTYPQFLPLNATETNVSDWQNWYHVNGIFVDGWIQGNWSYITNVNEFIHSLNLVSFGNGGLKYYNVGFDFWNSYERGVLPPPPMLNYTLNSTIIVYSISTLPSTSTLENFTQYGVKWMYISDSSGYQILPSYFSSEIAELNATTTS